MFFFNHLSYNNISTNSKLSILECCVVIWEQKEFSVMMLLMKANGIWNEFQMNVTLLCEHESCLRYGGSKYM